MIPKWDSLEETKLTEYLVKQIVSKANGESEAECNRNNPRDVYFIGNLSPDRTEATDDEHQDGYLREMLNKLSPCAFGSELKMNLQQDPINISVNLSWSCYYRIFPTFVQQKEHQFQNEKATIVSNSVADNELSKEPVTASLTLQKKKTSEDQSSDDSIGIDDPSDDIGASIDRKRERAPQDSLFIRFRKINCVAEGIIKIQIVEGEFKIDTTGLDTAVKNELV